MRFDHAAAEAALSEIRRTRENVVAALALQEPATDRAMAGWHGRTRDVTHEWLTHHQWALESLVNRLDALQSELTDAVDHALVEQARRDRLQAQWWQEWRDEQIAATEVEVLLR